MIHDLDALCDNDLLLTAINYSGVGIVICDANQEDLPIIFVNRGFEIETGYSKEEVYGKNCRFLQGPETNPTTIAKLSMGIKNQQALQVEILNYKKNGERFWNELTLNPVFNRSSDLTFYIGIQKDITTRKHTEKEREIFQKVIENTLQGVIITDQNQNIHFVNEAFTRTTGYTLNDVKGKNPNILSSGKQDKAFYRTMWQSLSDTGQWEGEIWDKKKDGTLYPELLNISSVKDEKGDISHYFAIFSDITRQKEIEYKLEELSSKDNLTALANRRFFDLYLKEKWEDLVKRSKPVSLIICDIDFFKKFNDTYGHLEGDQCLRSVAQIIRQSVDIQDHLVARYGGEEFVVVLPDMDQRSAHQLAETIRKNIEQKTIIHNQSNRSDQVTISLGVATLIPDSDTSTNQLILKADHALYQAKKNGRNRVEVYGNSMD